MIEFCHVQIVYLGTGITNLRRQVTPDEIKFHIEMALLHGGLSGVRHGDQPRLKSQIV